MVSLLRTDDAGRQPVSLRSDDQYASYIRRILLLILVIIAYGYRLIRRGNRELIRNTYYDPLTGAYNRRRFEYEIGPLIKKSCEYSIAALNVRQFKFINEIFGSRAADELLCHIRKVIVENVRAGGILLPQLRGSVLSLPARYTGRPYGKGLRRSLTGRRPAGSAGAGIMRS